VIPEIFHTSQPKNEVLKKHIHSFYFHQVDNSMSNKQIVFFPNTKNAVTIYKNAIKVEVSKTPKQIKIIQNKMDGYLFLYGGIQQKAVISEITTPFDKIGIIFEPLGINHFVEDNYIGRQIRSDYYFPPIESKLKPIIDSVYAATTIEKRVELLENFFLNQINFNFKEPVLKEALNLIEDYHGKLKINELVKKLNIEEKTLLRKFKNHLNCTPKHYSKVHQFRTALTKYFDSNKKINSLTDLAHNNYYYDQSDFIKSFKSLTGNKPSFFFKQINNFGNEIYWFN